MIAEGLSAGELATRYAEAETSEERIDWLHAMAWKEDPAIRALLLEAAADGDAEVRIAALAALAEQPRAEYLDAAAAALGSGDPEIKAEGLELLSKIRADGTAALWEQAVADADAEIALVAFALLREAPEPARVRAAIRAMDLDRPWAYEEALLLLGDTHSKAAVEALIPAVDHPESGDLARDGLFFLLSEHFDSSAEAARWWQANQARLDGTLEPLDQ